MRLMVVSNSYGNDDDGHIELVRAEFEKFRSRFQSLSGDRLGRHWFLASLSQVRA